MKRKGAMKRAAKAGLARKARRRERTASGHRVVDITKELERALSAELGEPRKRTRKATVVRIPPKTEEPS